MENVGPQIKKVVDKMAAVFKGWCREITWVENHGSMTVLRCRTNPVSATDYLTNLSK